MIFLLSLTIHFRFSVFEGPQWKQGTSAIGAIPVICTLWFVISLLTLSEHSSVGVFHVFYIAQVVPNRAKCLIYIAKCNLLTLDNIHWKIWLHYKTSSWKYNGRNFRDAENYRNFGNWLSPITCLVAIFREFKLLFLSGKAVTKE